MLIQPVRRLFMRFTDVNNRGDAMRILLMLALFAADLFIDYLDKGDDDD